MTIAPDQRGSRSYLSAILLTLAGGYLDAYTYHVRDGVFANAQTGNIIKLGLVIAAKETGRIIYYLLPVMAFILGVFASLCIENFFEKKDIPVPRRAVLATEVLMMLMISFLPQNDTCNIAANVMVSLLCAMQMQSFQIFKNQGIATTVATGNLRKATEYLYYGIRNKDRKQIRLSLIFFGIILLFIAGVILGALISRFMGIRSILVPALLLSADIIHITYVYHRITSGYEPVK
ncbi:MAG: DUF1275 domain-containing protein [Erysipelotrichaceae bacterium]|nr:DUF1275 domain-containing protein [Erysipelotrichaceae bacterium]